MMNHFDNWLAKQGTKVCPNCGYQKPDVESRRMSTAYHDEESNWITECAACFEYTQQYWDEMWREYRAGLY